MSQIFGM